ncbi:unnamed protein product, partial [Ectocarpus sp. 12 AP-2014]
ASGAEAIQALEAELDAQTKKIAGLESTVSGLAIPDIAPLESSLSDVSSKVTGLESSLTELGDRVTKADAKLAPLDTRLTEVEKRPLAEAVSEEAIAAYERELAGIQDSVATQRAEVESLIAETKAIEAEARKMEERAAANAIHAENRADVARLIGQLDGCAPFASILSKLTANGVDIPDAL